MNILFETRDRLKKSAIAGSSLISEDFRLKKLAESFSAVKDKSPVFAQIYSKLSDLLSADKETRAFKLLECIAFLDAVCTTQFTYDLPDAEIVPFKAYTDEVPETQIAYSEFYPIHEALTTTGGGRYAIIQSAYQQNSPVFKDIRILPELVAGLGDAYGEIGTLCSHILATYGKKVIPVLKDGFDPKGKTVMARRLATIAMIAGAEENEFYLYALDNGNIAVRTQALSALRYYDKNTDILIKATSTKNANEKNSALLALSKIKDGKADEFWIEFFKKHKDMETIIQEPYIVQGQSEIIKYEVTKFLREKLDNILENDKSYYWLLLARSIFGKDSPEIREIITKFFSRNTTHKQNYYSMCNDFLNVICPNYYFFPTPDYIDFMYSLAKILDGTVKSYQAWKSGIGFVPQQIFMLLLLKDPDYAFERFIKNAEKDHARATIKKIISMAFKNVVFDDRTKRYAEKVDLYQWFSYGFQFDYHEMYIPLPENFDYKKFSDALFTDDNDI